MNCAEANKVDLVDYLYSLGYTTTKLKDNDYWYLSPLRDKRTASFNIDRSKNVWYGHGTGNSGTVIDVASKYFNCDVQAAFQKLSKYVSENKIGPSMQSERDNDGISSLKNPHPFTPIQLSFQQQKDHQTGITNNKTDTPVHLHKRGLTNNEHTAEPAIKIIAAKQSVTNPSLCRYLKERCINKNIADTYCHEVEFTPHGKDKEYTLLALKITPAGTN